MNIYTIIDFFKKTSAPAWIIILLILSYLVDVSKLQLNPWKWLGHFFEKILKRIGSIMLADVSQDIAGIKSDVAVIKREHASLQSRLDKDGADACRNRILRFADECRRGVEHSEEFFNQVLEDVTAYERYCDEHPLYMNGKAEQAIKRINEVYCECQREDKFL